MAYRKPISPPEPTCTQPLECALTNPDPVALVLLVAAAGVVLLFVSIGLAHVTGARSLLDEERARIAAEAEAFGAFARQVANAEVTTTPVTDGGPVVTTTIEAAPSDEALGVVREAYHDTVMAVPHYDEEYDESLATNMRLEFGEDVADAVERGAALTPQLKATLVDRSRTAQHQRGSLLRQLDGEADALDEAEAVLCRCRRSADRLQEAHLGRCSFDELTAEWRLLEDRRAEAEQLLAERQEVLGERGHETGGRPGGPSFEEYLYEPMDVTHPVLAAGIDVVDRLERARSRVERALASRT